MSPTIRRWLLGLLAVVVVGGLLACLAVAEYEHHRVQKIDFIIDDNQHGHVVAATQEELLRYLQGCGAQVDHATSVWNARYNGFFQHWQWKFEFAPPGSSKLS